MQYIPGSVCNACHMCVSTCTLQESLYKTFSLNIFTITVVVLNCIHIYYLVFWRWVERAELHSGSSENTHSPSLHEKKMPYIAKLRLEVGWWGGGLLIWRERTAMEVNVSSVFTASDSVIQTLIITSQHRASLPDNSLRAIYHRFFKL